MGGLRDFGGRNAGSSSPASGLAGACDLPREVSSSERAHTACSPHPAAHC